MKQSLQPILGRPFIYLHGSNTLHLWGYVMRSCFRRTFCGLYAGLPAICFALVASGAMGKPKPQPKTPDTTQPAVMDWTAVKLPAAADAVSTGGAGKYLVLHLAKLQQLAIFDVSQRKIVKYLPVPTDDLVFCASMDKLFIGLKELRQIQRWDLARQKLELTVNAPEGGIAAMVTGAAVNGPVILLAERKSKRCWVLDPTTLAARKFPSTHWGNDGGAWGPVHIHVSFDGSTVIACGGGWAGVEISSIIGNDVADNHAGGYASGDTLISGNGALVFPEKSEILHADLTSKVSGIEGTPIPADDPDFSLAVLKKSTLSLFSNADARPLITLGNLPELEQTTRMPLGERIHLIPSMNALVTLAEGGKELRVRKFDLATQLAASGIDYLFVGSTPPSVAHRGARYEYAMKVQSKRGKVKAELQSGPPGMALDSGTSTITWNVPKTFADDSASVIVQIGDASGQTIFQTFVLRVVGDKPAVVAVAPPPPVVSTPPARGPKPAPANPAPAAPPAMPTRTHPAAQPPEAAAGPYIGEVTHLEEPFKEFHAAAGGKTLVFYEPKARQLALYDAVTGKATGVIPMGADNVRFTCGADSIIVALPDQKILQRYSLKTRGRLKSAPIPENKPLKDIKMGNASAGPVFLYFGNELVAIDETTLLPIRHSGKLPAGNPDWWFDYRVSADGSTVVAWDPYASPSGFIIGHLHHGVASTINSADVWSMATRKFTATADGSFVMYGTKFFSALGKAVSCDLREKGYWNCLPTSDRRFFIAVKQVKNGTGMALCTTNDRRILTEIDSLPDLGNADASGDWSHCGLCGGNSKGEPRLIYLPDSSSLAVIPKTDDEFGVMKFSVGSTVAGATSGTPAPASQTLAVISLPSPQVALNSTYSYQIEIVPAKTTAKYKIEAGPPGLTVSGTGLVTWKPTERPVGGKANVILSISDAAGHEVPHAFDIAVTRPVASAPDGTVSTGEIAKADASRIELPSEHYQYTIGRGGHGLILSGNQLAITAADGFTIQKTQTLPRSYIAIAEREKYYVAISNEPRTIDLIDKVTLKTIRSRAVAFSALIELTLHPTRPICYISYVQQSDVPSHHFLILDETTGDAHTNDNWIGQWLCISPNGRFLMAGWQEIYQAGHDIIDNPDRIWIVPRYGSIDSMARYDLDAHGIPDRVAFREDVGGGGVGLRLSPDGKQATYLSNTGYPQGSKNLGGWDPLDLSKLPVNYNCKDGASTHELAFHPLLPIVACCGKGEVIFFNRESGEKQEPRIDEDKIAGETIERLYFSPDGKTLLVESGVDGIHYLHHLPLKLSPEESRAAAALPRPDKPLDPAQQSPPPDPAPGKLPQMRA
ncbi:MAG TPA: hypothetical protein VFE47_30240 [Tepidisphaeraceae bacterium]|nr:hypothetical protein [Tepidisphaeraceae bacterium]